MAKLNKRGIKTVRPAALSPVATTTQDTVTFEGAAAWSRDAKSDLFLLGVTNFFGEDTFYEKSNDRNTRFIGLVHQVAREDPGWLLGFVPWLRRSANIRTAAVVAAVEGARALAREGQPGSEMGPARRLIRETLLRADEPAEALSYWLSTYGKKMPGPVRRGIADAASVMYTERNVLKYDSDRRGVRMADVIALTHPAPFVDPLRQQDQPALFRYLLDSRHRPTDLPESLKKMRYQKVVLNDLRGPERATLLADEGIYRILDQAGVTWEALSSTGPMDRAAWEAIIPNLGYMALLRNLRNFTEAGVSEETKGQVIARLLDTREVAASRQLPYRFLSAYLEATDPSWVLPLSVALQNSMHNVPELPGRTLVLVDTSASMSGTTFSAKSKITPVMAGALFGTVLAAKGEQVDLHGYATGVFKQPVRRGAGILHMTEAFIRRVGEVGHGTETAFALRSTWDGHDRVVIVTDCQTFGYGNVGDQIPSHIPIYAFNLGGYAPAMMATSKTRHELGGLTDRTFAMIPLVEAGQAAKWPWES